jgi:prepilin-type N-terminal cleavage/methylation domain-containing protein
MRTRRDSGFTLIEVLVAMTVLAIGIFGTVGVFDYSRQQNSVSERVQTAAHQAERELERITSCGYGSVYISGLGGVVPTHSATTTDPDYYITDPTIPGTPPTYQWDNSATYPTLTKTENLLIDATTPSDQHCKSPSGVDLTLHGPITWSAGGLTGSLYRYVTWVGDGCPNCKGITGQDYKRVTVAVTVAHPANQGPKRPIVLSTVVTNPLAGPGATG